MADEKALSNMGMTDEIIVELNPEPWDAEPSAPAIPARPAASAPRAKWVEFCVALGADREFLETETLHFKNLTGDGRPVFYGAPAMSRAELKRLAGRLGG